MGEGGLGKQLLLFDSRINTILRREKMPSLGS